MRRYALPIFAIVLLLSSCRQVPEGDAPASPVTVTSDVTVTSTPTATSVPTASPTITPTPSPTPVPEVVLQNPAEVLGSGDLAYKPEQIGKYDRVVETEIELGGKAQKALKGYTGEAYDVLAIEGESGWVRVSVYEYEVVDPETGKTLHVALPLTIHPDYDLQDLIKIAPGSAAAENIYGKLIEAWASPGGQYGDLPAEPGQKAEAVKLMIAKAIASGERIPVDFPVSPAWFQQALAEGRTVTQADMDANHDNGWDNEWASGEWDPATGVGIMMPSSVKDIDNLPNDVSYRILYGRRMYVERGGYMSGYSIIVDSGGRLLIVRANSEYGDRDDKAVPVYINDFWAGVFTALDQLGVARGIGRYEPKDAFYKSVHDFKYKPWMWEGIEQPNN